MSRNAGSFVLENEVAGEVGSVRGEDWRGREREDEESLWEVRVEVKVFTVGGQESEESEPI